MCYSSKKGGGGGAGGGGGIGEDIGSVGGKGGDGGDGGMGGDEGSPDSDRRVGEPCPDIDGIPKSKSGYTPGGLSLISIANNCAEFPIASAQP